MLSYKKGKVVEVLKKDESSVEVLVKYDNGLVNKAIGYIAIISDIRLGDCVICNTTATELKLGTGGYDFIIFNYSNENKDLEGDGHIMKLRYTPQQVKCLSIEEESSKYHEDFLNFTNLNGKLYIICTLHSMLAPIALSLKYLDENIKINYIMTDAGCLPIAFSNTVKRLKKENIIENTITVGHAFGGDYEAVNIYNGIIASYILNNAEVTIISMGPGIVGTGTKYGFSGIEQGEITNAVESLGGKSLFVPRIGFKDKRQRHYGLSHQTKTVLEKVVKVNTDVVLQKLSEGKKDTIEEQIRSIDNNFVNFCYEDGSFIEDAFNKFGYEVKTMGRGINEEQEYFHTLGAVAKYAFKHTKSRR